MTPESVFSGETTEASFFPKRPLPVYYIIEVDLVLDELEDCVSDPTDVEMVIEQKEMARVIRKFLDALPATERRVFLRRYWYMDSVAGIALDFDFTESKTASMLHRIRKKLREKLGSEGYL